MLIYGKCPKISCTKVFDKNCKQCRPRSDLQKQQSDQGQNCLPSMYFKKQLSQKQHFYHIELVYL